MMHEYFSRDLEDIEDFDARSLSSAPLISSAGMLGASSALDKAAAMMAEQAPSVPAQISKAAQESTASAALDAVPVPATSDTPRAPVARAALPHEHRARGIRAVIVCYADGRKVVAL